METELLKPELWIGVDQSYSGFGLVWMDNNDYTAHLFDFTKGKKSGGERLRTIYDLISWHLWGLEHHYECHVAMEGYSHGSKFNREILGELGGIVKLAIYDVFKKEPLIVPPTVLKKYVTGKGTASKTQMIEHVNSRWGTHFDNDNLADSYALAQYCKEA